VISVSRSGVHIGKVRLLWWVERATFTPGEWWTVHITLHRYGRRP
jgi:hypothetical protein